MRVTGTEGNIAYRTADYERWQQLDFVEGIEINTSHTNHPVADICDELKGVYPKEFKWTGWHPMCRCNATAKMSDFDAFLAKQQEYIDNGTQPDYSENKVIEMPDNFTKWVNDNESRIANATSLPYFLADNGKLSKGKYRIQLGRTTQKQGVGNAKLGRAATKEAYKDYEGKGALKLDGELLENANNAAKSVGIKRRSDMTWEEADNKNTNPNFKPNSTTADNCQTCVVVHEARLRGIDVTALPYNEDNDVFVKLGDNFERAWINPKTKKAPKPMEYRKGSFEQMVSALEKQCSAVGRYHIGLNWEDDLHSKEIGIGQVLTAERLQNGKFRYFDPQIGEFVNIKEYAEYGMQYLESIKVDNLLINTNILKMICRVV